MKRKKGFTLIELLVVISIISLLSSIVLASLNTARSKARDAQRQSDLAQIQNALELYYDKYGYYPSPQGAANDGTAICNSGLNAHGDPWCRDTTANDGATQIADWIPGLSEFIKLPHNPKPYGPALTTYGWGPYHYYSPNKSEYILMGQLENQSGASCGGGSTYTWFPTSSNGVAANQNLCTIGWGGSYYFAKIMK